MGELGRLVRKAFCLKSMELALVGVDAADADAVVVDDVNIVPIPTPNLFPFPLLIRVPSETCLRAELTEEAVLVLVVELAATLVLTAVSVIPMPPLGPYLPRT